jgi:PAS domain S-box-containing protein
MSVCDALTSGTPFALATISVGDNTPARRIHILAAAGKALGYLDGISMAWDDSPLGNGPAGCAWRSGEVQCNDDLLADARYTPWRDRARAYGFRSSFVLPVSPPGGAVAVLLSIYSEQKSAVDREQLELFRLLGDDLGVCIEVLRNRTALQDASKYRVRQDREIAVLQSAFESSVAAVVVTGADSRIKVVNPAFETLFGYSREHIIGQNPSVLASGRHGSEYFHEMWEQLRNRGCWSGDIVNRGQDGREVVCWLSISALRNSNHSITHYVGSYRDITDQLQSMESLRREQRFANAIMESMPGIVYFYDASGRFRRWNRNFLDVSGYSAEELQGMRPLDFFDSAHKQLMQDRIGNVFENGTDSVEAPFVTKSGVSIPYLFTGRRLNYAGENFLIGVGIDISKRKLAEQALDAQLERLQSLSRQVLEIQEQERNRLGRELHDSVAQDIGAVSLNLTILRNLLGQSINGALAQRLDDSQALLEEAAHRVRDLMVELRPPGLDEFGLVAALAEHANRVAHRVGISITVNGSDPKPRFPATVAISLFRIAQEALNNVVKHARASEVHINLDVGFEEVILEVDDNGSGFDLAGRSASGTRGMGLLTMSERAESIGGRCSVRSTVGKGTRVRVSAPRPKRSQQDSIDVA